MNHAETKKWLQGFDEPKRIEFYGLFFSSYVTAEELGDEEEKASNEKILTTLKETWGWSDGGVIELQSYLRHKRAQIKKFVEESLAGKPDAAQTLFASI